MPRLTHHSTRDQNADRWRRLVHDYRSSPLSQRAFCAEHGVALSSFTKWRRRVAGTPSTATATAEDVALAHNTGFVPVRVIPVTSPPPSSTRSLSIELPGGLLIQNIDAENVTVVAALIAAL